MRVFPKTAIPFFLHIFAVRVFNPRPQQEPDIFAPLVYDKDQDNYLINLPRFIILNILVYLEPKEIHDKLARTCHALLKKYTEDQ